MIADRELPNAYRQRAQRIDTEHYTAESWTTQTRGGRHEFGSRAAAATLTPREREIALLLAAEQASNRAISARLSISIRTVETHIERIFSKLEIHTRADVAAAYLS